MSSLLSTTTYPYGERRFTHRLLRYWEELCNGRSIPLETDLDPDVLGNDWEQCFLLQSRDVANIQDYNFTYLGKRILDAYSDGSLDAHNEAMISPNAYRLSTHFMQVLETKAPLIDHGTFINLRGRRVAFRQILLPLGTDGKPVEAIFGGMNYKIAR
jgi:hypothetical protein